MRVVPSLRRQSSKQRLVSVAQRDSADRIQRSSHDSSGTNASDDAKSPAASFLKSGWVSFSTALMTRRDACHILLLKLRPSSSLASSKKTSLPGGDNIESVKRNASVPHLSMMSSGSGELPSDLLILRPMPSRTMPVRKT